VAGKADWRAAGQPTEGKRAGVPRIGSIADRDVVACTVDTPAEEVHRALNGRALAVVVNGRVVLGVVRQDDIAKNFGRPVGELMQEAPPTMRADVPVEELETRLQDLDVDTALVTTPQGELIGVVHRSG
jgi:CBS domain-containing protein